MRILEGTYTAHHIQLVVMSLKPLEEIGEEVHHLDQFLRVEEGEAPRFWMMCDTRLKRICGCCSCGHETQHYIPHLLRR